MAIPWYSKWKGGVWKSAVVLGLVIVLLVSRSSDSYGIGPVHLGMAASQSQVELFEVKAARLRRGSWGTGDESGIFVTTPSSDGQKVIKIDYAVHAKSRQRFDSVVAALLKRYGSPAARGPLAVLGSPASLPGEEQFSYGWGTVRVENDTVVSDPSGRAIVLRARRFDGGTVLLAIADGPLVRRYLAYSEDDFFEDPRLRDERVRRKRLADYGYSLTEHTTSTVYGWKEEGLSFGPGVPTAQYTSEFTTPAAYAAWRGFLIGHFKDGIKITATIAILRTPYQSLQQIESSVGKADRVDKQKDKLFSRVLASWETCYSWFDGPRAAAEDRTASSKGKISLDEPFFGACFDRRRNDEIESIGFRLLRTEAGKETEITELVGRTAADWHREGEVRRDPGTFRGGSRVRNLSLDK